jgi:hypothetical protein
LLVFQDGEKKKEVKEERRGEQEEIKGRRRNLPSWVLVSTFSSFLS